MKHLSKKICIVLSLVLATSIWGQPSFKVTAANENITEKDEATGGIATAEEQNLIENDEISENITYAGVDSVSGATPNGTQLVEINTADDLVAMSANFGSTEYPKNAIYSLTADIDMAGKAFTMMGNSSDVSTKFSGIFCGNGHTISNLTITSSSEAGLFAVVNANGIIEEVTFLNPIVKATSTYSNNIGVAAAKSYGEIKECFVIGGKISGGSNVGGLIGSQDGNSITNCSVDENTTVTSIASGISSIGIGGLVGSITGSSSNPAILTQCFSYATVNGGVNVGGIAGDTTNVNLTNCYSSGTITSTYRNVGGIIGHVAYGGGIISNCYSTAKVINNISNNGYIGGIVGRITNGMSEFSNNISINESLEGTKYMGYVLGGGTYLPVLTSNQAWDEITLSGTNQLVNVGSRPTQEELSTKETFESMGWDFNEIWEWVETRTGSYPILRGLSNQINTYPFAYDLEEIPHTVAVTPDAFISDWENNIKVTITLISEAPITEKYYFVSTLSNPARSVMDSWIPVSDNENVITIDINTYDSGIYFIHWKAIKQFELIGSGTVPLGAYKLDKTAPSNLKFTAASAAITNGTFDMTVEGTDEHSGIAKYAFTKDSELLTDELWQDSPTMSYTGLLTSENYELRAYAMDSAGNISQALIYQLSATAGETEEANSGTGKESSNKSGTGTTASTAKNIAAVSVPGDNEISPDLDQSTNSTTSEEDALVNQDIDQVKSIEGLVPKTGDYTWMNQTIALMTLALIVILAMILKRDMKRRIS